VVKTSEDLTVRRKKSLPRSDSSEQIMLTSHPHDKRKGNVGGENHKNTSTGEKKFCGENHTKITTNEDYLVNPKRNDFTDLPEKFCVRQK
jgi:hypothetical protein